MVKVHVITEILIGKPIDIVAAYATEPDNAPEWYVNIKSANWETPKPLKVGSLITFTASFMGRDLTYTYEITELIEGEKLVMRTHQGPFPMQTIYEWSAFDESSTHMTLTNTGRPSGFSKLLSPFMVWAMKRANNKDLKRLKTILENI